MIAQTTLVPASPRTARKQGLMALSRWSSNGGSYALTQRWSQCELAVLRILPGGASRRTEADLGS